MKVWYSVEEIEEPKEKENQLRIFDDNGLLVVDSRELAPFLCRNHKYLRIKIRECIEEFYKKKQGTNILDYFIQTYYIDCHHHHRVNFF